MHQSFYGHGKLLLTSEYFVMDGAPAIALPTKLGQRMDIRINEEPSSDPTLKWEAKDPSGQTWISCSLNLKNFEAEENNSKMLQDILQQTRCLNPHFLKEPHDVNVQTNLEFSNDWGLGSSSTLIYMVSQWASVNPFDLLELTFEGSGYDIACAGSEKPIMYHIEGDTPDWRELNFSPDFKDSLYFVHLNHKQSSRVGIQHYRDVNPPLNPTLQELKALSNKILNTSRLDDFEQLIIQHEDIISNALQLPKVKTTLFSDYWGEIKSLGAWGGDFVLATSNKSSKETNDYFHQRGYKTVLMYDDLIL